MLTSVGEQVGVGREQQNPPSVRDRTGRAEGGAGGGPVDSWERAGSREGPGVVSETEGREHSAPLSSVTFHASPPALGMSSQAHCYPQH